MNVFLSSHKGLTLIELLMTVAVLALITMVALPSYTEYIDKAKIEVAITDIYKIEAVIEHARYSNADKPPNSLSEIHMDTLQDPWGHPYQFLNHANVKGKGKLRKDKNLVPLNTDYDLYSMGKDGRSTSPLTAKHSRDDVIRANNGGFVGLASEY